MTRRIYVCPFAAFVGLLALSLVVQAQTASATLGGTMLDESSAVIPDARITVVNLDTGRRRETAADAQGRFAVPFLSPGRYRVTAKRDGVRPAQIAGLDLNLGANIALHPLLKVPPLGTTGTRSAYAPPSNTPS